MLRIGRLAENDRKCFEIDKIAKHGLHLYRKTANDLLLFLLGISTLCMILFSI